MAETIACPYCGKKADRASAFCPHCGGPLSGKEPAAAQPATSANLCTHCGAPVRPSDIVCERCGFNLVTGQRIAPARPEAPAAPAKAASEAPSSRIPSMELEARPLLWAALALVLVGFAALAGFLLIRDPLVDAAAMAKNNRAGEAIARLQAFVQTHPQRADAFLLLGKVLYQEQQFADASDAFATARKLDAKLQDAGMMALLALHKSGAKNALEKEAALLAELERAPGAPPETKWLHGLVSAVAKDYPKASEALKTAAEGQGPAEARVCWAASEALRGNLEQAAKALAENTKEVQASADAVLGLVAGLQGQPAEAAAKLEAALQAEGGADPLLQTRLGLIYLAQGENEKALGVFSKVPPDPANDAAAFFRGICLENMKSNSDALAAYDPVMRGKGPYAGRAALQSAALLVNLNDATRADEAAMMAIQAGDDSAKLHTLRGRIQALQGDLSAASNAYKTALAKDPNYPAVHLEMGLMYIAQGMTAEGLKEFDKFMELGQKQGGGTSLNEVELLIEQLKKSTEQPGR